MIKDLKYYISLDYNIAVRDLEIDEGGGILAYYIDLPFIMGDGNTKDEAIEDLKSAFKSYVVDCLKNKDRILEPKSAQKSKRINITLPNDLLNKIDDFIKNNNISRSAFLQQASRQVLAS